MKRYIIVLLCLTLSYFAFAQDVNMRHELFRIQQELMCQQTMMMLEINQRINDINLQIITDYAIHNIYREIYDREPVERLYNLYLQPLPIIADGFPVLLSTMDIIDWRKK